MRRKLRAVDIFAPMRVASPPAVTFGRSLLPVWLVTAAWDFACATALSVFAYGGTAAGLWRGVAATALGPTALQGGAPAVAAGIALHLAVAFTWSFMPSSNSNDCALRLTGDWGLGTGNYRLVAGGLCLLLADAG